MRLNRLWVELRKLAERRWLRLGAQALVLLFCIFYLATHLRGIQDLIIDLEVNYMPLLAAWFLTVVAVFLGALGWWLTVRGLGQPAGALLTVRAHVLSNVAKYVPGYIWQYMGKAYLSQEAGLNLRVSGLAMILELSQLVWIGLAIAVAIVPVESAQEWTGIHLHSGYLYITGFLMLLCLIAFVLALPWILRTAWHGRDHTQVRPIAFLGAIAAMFAAWLVFGYSFWMLAAAFQPVSAYDIPLFVFTLVASFLIGLAVIVVPSGIGIREGVMVLILGAYMPEPLAVLLAALSRVVLFLSELTSVFLLKAILRFTRTDRTMAKDDQRLVEIGEGKQNSDSTQRRRR